MSIQQRPLSYLIVCIALLGLFKNNRAVKLRYLRYLKELERRFHIRLRISKFSIKMSGVIIIKGITLQVKNVLIKIDFCSVKFNFLKLYRNGLLGSIDPYLEGIFIVEQRSFNYNSAHEYVNETKTNRNWDSICFNLIKKITYYFFKRRIKVELADLYIDVRKMHFEFKKIFVIENRISANFKLQLMSKAWTTYIANGIIDRLSNQVAIQIEREIGEQNDEGFFFDKIEVDVRQTSETPEIGLDIEMSISNVQVFLKKIYPDRLKIGNIYLNFELKSSLDHFIITNNSGGSIVEIPFAFSFIHTSSENDILKMDLFLEVSQQFITSFPKFQNIGLSYIKTNGKLVLQFQLMFNVFDPFEYYFNLNIIENTLKILGLDKFDLNFLKDDLHQIENLPLISRNLLSRGIKEMPIAKVADDFLKIIVSSEDPFFYTHKGVDPYSVGYAVVSNISAKAFLLGASTITMQVARNLFLDFDKNIIRKIEEVIISLIIENHFRIPKRRILEIYINIIEFGPGIYGIEQACLYYFRKLPIEISAKESIVLSYIIPRPIHFHDALLLKTPQLLRNLPRYVDEKSKALLQKGIISFEDYGSIRSDIVFANGLGRIAFKEEEA